MRPISQLSIVGAIAALASIGVCAVSNEYYLHIAFMICVNYLSAAGMGILVGYAGQKSLGQAGLFAAGAYGASLLTSHSGMSPWLALALAVIVSGLCGALLALPASRVKGPYLAMVSLAFGIVIEKLVTEWTDVFGGAEGIYDVRPLTWDGAALSMKQWVWLAVGMSFITFVLMRNLACGRVGRALLSLQFDEIAAASAGVRVDRFKVIAFTVAAMTSGLAGGLVALQGQYINSDFITVQLSIFILLMVLFGGVRSLFGPMVGAAVLTLIDAELSKWPAAQHFVYGAVLLFGLYLMPEGIMGAVASWFTRLRPKAAPRPGSFSWRKLTFPNRFQSGPLLTVQNVNKSYGGVRPANDISFELNSGHIHALIGPNGAGKSTMINLLTGVVRADSGRIFLRGVDLCGRATHSICDLGIARTFQNLRLFGEMSVLDNVLIGRHSRMRNGLLSVLFSLPRSGREEAKARERAFELLLTLGLGDVADSPASALPYGLQRRVELARALASDPELLLLDEPAAGLNPQETAELGNLLVEISKCGVTILMVEHHMDLVMRISDHVIVLDYGKKIAEGAPAQVQANPAVIAAYLGVDDGEELAASAPSLIQEGSRA